MKRFYPIGCLFFFLALGLCERGRSLYAVPPSTYAATANPNSNSTSNPNSIFSPSLKIVVSIPPLFSLAKDLLEGIAEVSLLLTTQSSPHTYYMKPSDIRHIEEADLVLWVGPDLESFLEPLLKKHSSKAFSMMAIKGITLYPYSHTSSHENLQGHCDHSHGHLDPHLWLDPCNMMHLTDALKKHVETALLSPAPLVEKEQILARLEENQIRLHAKLRRLEMDLRGKLRNAVSASFFVAHDALQYLEKRYGMRHALQMHASFEKGLTLKRLKTLKKVAHQTGARCLFGDQAYDPNLLNKFARKLGLYYQTLDILGYSAPHESLPYEDMMRLLVDDITVCLLKENAQ